MSKMIAEQEGVAQGWSEEGREQNKTIQAKDQANQICFSAKEVQGQVSV